MFTLFRFFKKKETNPEYHECDETEISILIEELKSISTYYDFHLRHLQIINAVIRVLEELKKIMYKK